MKFDNVQANIQRISMETSYYKSPIPIQGVRETVSIDYHLRESRIYMIHAEVSFL